MSLEFPSQMIEGLQYSKEKSRIVESLFRRSIDVLIRHGKPESDSSLKTRVILFLGSSFPLTDKEIFHSTSVRKLISDAEGNNSVKVSVTSFGERKPAEARVIAVKVPFITGPESDLCTLLLTRSDKGELHAQLWNSISGGGCHLTSRVSVDDLESFSQMLTILQENLDVS